VDPKQLRRYLTSRQCRLHKKKHNGIEVWRKDGLNKPIQFYNVGEIQPMELRRILETLELSPTDLGNWRRENDVPA